MYVHIRGSNKWTLDSTPLVAGAEYCAEIGFTDGRNRCPVRPEGHPEREACEAYTVGLAQDTGRTGPTWTRNGDYCNGSDCENHPDNQYLLWARKGGHYMACVEKRRLRLCRGEPLRATCVTVSGSPSGVDCRRGAMRRLLVTLLAAGVLGWGCTLPDDQPTEPAPVPERPSTVAPAPPPSGGASEPVLGSPSSTPAPEPEATPEDPPSDTATQPAASGCGAPEPPELGKMKIVVHLRGPNSWTLDATPLVGPDPEYCAEIGFTDGRAHCPVRPEGHPEREACETLVVGVAADTGRPGPTWRRNGSLCTGQASGCENDTENQYLVKAFSSGMYTACARDGVCGELLVDK